ncbi:MAG TPA: acetoin utilization protein AcuC [Burkholderiales bacterium]|nr:acetoin utilization protein AcuC [Burkholderiales bacterium]
MTACLYADELLAGYGFPEGHPFGADRQDAFLQEAKAQGLLDRVQVEEGQAATTEMLERFHQREYVEKVRSAESTGISYLDAGDTPVFPNVFETSSRVVGSALKALDDVMSGKCVRSFQPIGGLHHAGRGHAAGFCVFNDLGVVIETLRTRYGVKRIGYVDIDVHFGDGVFYAFEDDPDVIIADIHQDPRTLYPGTGFEQETGSGPARGTKLNIALPPGSGDREFADAWSQVERHFGKFQPEFIVFQCGADGLNGDPLAGLRYTSDTHTLAARKLCEFADLHANGRVMAFGGGGYSRDNLGKAWSAVLTEMLA